MATSDWTAVNIDVESNEIVKMIQEIQHSPFIGATSIQILISAAAISLNKKLNLTKEYKRGTDITNKNLITEEQKWFMCMLTYSLTPDPSLIMFSDRSQIVKTFEQYAQCGLPVLLDICKDRNSRDTLLQLLENHIEYFNTHKP